MALTVLCVGFGRTGTLSLKFALEKLVGRPCYHMFEVSQNPGHAEIWSTAADGEKVAWEALFADYGAAVDWPAAYFWRELATFYTEAKVILTVRSAESWYKSCHQTIFQRLAQASQDLSPVHAARDAMAKKIIYERTFDGRTDDADHCMAVFKRHNEEVRRAIPAERLLVYESGQGWEPICKFLGLAVPDSEYPRVNSTEEFRTSYFPF